MSLKSVDSENDVKIILLPSKWQLEKITTLQHKLRAVILVLCQNFEDVHVIRQDAAEYLYLIPDRGSVLTEGLPVK